MKFRGLIIAAVVLAALEGALYWSSHHKPAEVKDAAASAPPKILSLQQDDISKLDLKQFDLKQKDGGVALAKNAAGTWQITAPQPLSADQSAVSNLLSTVSSVTSDRLVDDKATNLGQYGLAQPALEVAVTEKNNKTERLLIGDETPEGNNVYAKLDGDPRVFTVPEFTKTSLDKTSNDLRDRRLFTVKLEKISRVEVVAKNKDMGFGRNQDEWQIVKPKPLRADQTSVGELVRTLADAQMQFGKPDDPAKTAKAFASGTPVATAKLTDESGAQQLQVRKNGEVYYGESSAIKGVYQIEGAVGLDLEKSIDDFRNKKLFDFADDDPSKLELRDGAKAYFLSRNGLDWWLPDGKKADSYGVLAFVDMARNLSASKFVDSGFTTATIEISATSKEGKRLERVLIAKAGDNYIAKRENEPALYQLDAKSVENLEAAAANLKPVEPAKAVPGKK